MLINSQLLLQQKSSSPKTITMIMKIFKSLSSCTRLNLLITHSTTRIKMLSFNNKIFFEIDFNTLAKVHNYNFHIEIDYLA